MLLFLFRGSSLGNINADFPLNSWIRSWDLRNLPVNQLLQDHIKKLSQVLNTRLKMIVFLNRAIKPSLAFVVTSSNSTFRNSKRYFDANARHRKESVLELMRPSLTYLNFGLDVVPSMKLKLPDIIIIKIVCVPFYIIVMMFWFPILPVIQQVKIYIFLRLSDAMYFLNFII